MSAETQVAQKQPLSPSLRFTNKVMTEYGQNAGAGVIKLDEHQKRIIQGYFVVIDRMLKKSEDNRLSKNATNQNHSYDNNTPFAWNTVSMAELALDAVHYARMGLDMQEKNHLFPIPFLNKKTNLYDITFMMGYSGIQYLAEKYAFNPPKSVTIELVWSKDEFSPIKKSRSNPIESYEFKIVSPFDRGEIIGGFGYIEYEDTSRNELILMSKADIEKRKPAKASGEFWGGTGYVYEGGKRVKTELEGWYPEMCYKTLVREVYSSKHIPRDPRKVDDDYQHLKEREVIYAEAEIAHEAEENANKIPFDVTPQIESKPQATAIKMPTASEETVPEEVHAVKTSISSLPEEADF
jgi:recombination protein RecT